jgi:ankyrin repeat protein
VAEFLLIKGAKVNAIDELGLTPLGNAIRWKVPEIVNLLRKHGGKTGEELKAEGK